MGAGCYYTHNCNKEIAYWVNVPRDEDDIENENFDYILGEIQQTLKDLGYYHEKPNEFRNGLVAVFLESTYNSNGIVIRIEPLAEEGYSDWDDRLYRLAMANHSAIERRIARALSKEGLTLHFATSGYTFGTIDPGEFKG